MSTSTYRRLTANQKAALRGYRSARNFAVPPENQGQIIVASYGCDQYFIFERSVDLSDRSVCITAYRHPAGATDWNPGNCVPDLGRRVGVIYSGPASDEPSRD